MPTDAVAVEQPKHPVHQLTTAELTRYGRELENAIQGIPETAPIQPTLHRKLDAVIAEQADRARIAANA
jgi:hypothetical protein